MSFSGLPKAAAVGAQIGREIARDFVDDLAGAVHEIFARAQRISGGGSAGGRLVTTKTRKSSGAGFTVSVKRRKRGGVRRWRGVGDRFEGGRRHVNRGGVVQLEQDRAEDERGSERAEQNGDLLIPRRRADEEAGLQILRSGAAVGRRDANDAADGKRGHEIARPGPADEQKNQAGQQQGGHRHAGDRIRTGTDLTR